MPSTSYAFGFQPINNETGELRLSPYVIASGYAQNVYTGDPVKIDTSGTIQLATSDGTRSGTTDGEPLIGIFQGVRYRDALGKIQELPYWPASTVATEVEARVIVPRSTMFRVQFLNPSPGTSVQTYVGDQCDWRPNESPAGVAQTGISRTYLTAVQATRGQFIIRGFEPGIPLTDTYVTAYVSINEHDISAAVNIVS